MICKGGKPENQASHSCFIYNSCRMACQEQAVFRPSYSPVYSLLWEASFVHNTQFTIHLCPVADRTGPFLRSFKCGKIQCL